MAPRDDVDDLLDALAVTAELTGTELTKSAARVMVADLQAYPLNQVLSALSRCRRELKGRLTLAAILERLDDGRPTPNEAWAMIPQDEAGSVVWTDEMALAFGAAHPLIAAGQIIAARATFIEVYERECMTARSECRQPRWSPSLGHDQTQRAGALETAVRLGRLGADHAQKLLPAPDRDDAARSLLALSRAAPPDVRQKLANLKLIVRGGSSA